jgi:hypothetical protein
MPTCRCGLIASPLLIVITPEGSWHHAPGSSSRRLDRESPAAQGAQISYSARSIYCHRQTNESAHNGGYLRASSVRGGCGASGHGGSRAAWQRRLCPGPRAGGSGPSPEARLICSGVASRHNCFMGVQLGFMGVQLGGKGHMGWFAGLRLRHGNVGRQREAVAVAAR